MKSDMFFTFVNKSKVTPFTGQIWNPTLLKDPVFKLSRYMGVFFFTDNLRISLFSVALGYILFAGLVVERVFIYVYFPFASNVRSTMLIYVTAYLLNWMISLFWPKNPLRQALKELSTILRKLDVVVNSTWLFITFLLFLVVKNVMDLKDPKYLVYEVVLLFLSAPTYLLPLQYFLISRAITKAFVELNKQLLESEPVTFRSLAATHCKLCQLCHMITEHYGPVILVDVCSLIALSMTYIYLFISTTNMPVKDLTKLAIRIVFFFASTFYGVYGAFLIQNASDNFNKTLKGVLISKKTSYQENLRVYLKMKVVVHPTACGFFTLKPMIYVQILAGLVSYTVVLLQFSGQDKIPLSV